MILIFTRPHATVSQFIDWFKKGHGQEKNLFQVGLWWYYPDNESFVWMRQQVFRDHIMRKKGISDKAFLAPLTVDDNRKKENLILVSLPKSCNLSGLLLFVNDLIML